jgi:hypothetical protein
MHPLDIFNTTWDENTVYMIISQELTVKAVENTKHWPDTYTYTLE